MNPTSDELDGRAIRSVGAVLGGDTRRWAELADDIPTQSELRVVQAQLTGWLEGLMQGVGAALWNQQVTAQRQLEEVRLAAQHDHGSPPPRAARYL